jgi:hypothetical protein
LLVHGEADVAAALAARIEERFGWAARAPQQGEIVQL